MKIEETLKMVNEDYLLKVKTVLNLPKEYEFCVDNKIHIIPSDEQLEKLEAYAYLNYKFRLLYNDVSSMLSSNSKADEKQPFFLLAYQFNIKLDLDKIENKIK